ncbi:hypothetical protein C8J56DRAFT_882212 [Mycena floridula]|nr:hypothetical protein C8J56DRAFT_882212 [Mycena floridula]
MGSWVSRIMESGSASKGFHQIYDVKWHHPSLPHVPFIAVPKAGSETWFQRAEELLDELFRNLWGNWVLEEGFERPITLQLHWLARARTAIQGHYRFHDAHPTKDALVKTMLEAKIAANFWSALICWWMVVYPDWVRMDSSLGQIFDDTWASLRDCEWVGVVIDLTRDKNLPSLLNEIPQEGSILIIASAGWKGYFLEGPRKYHIGKELVRTRCHRVDHLDNKLVVVVYLSLARRDTNVSLSELYGSRDLLRYQRGPAWGEIFSSRTGLLKRPGFSGLDKGIMPLAISESRQPVNHELTLLGAIGGKGASKLESKFEAENVSERQTSMTAFNNKERRVTKGQAVESRTEVAQARSGRAMRDIVSYLKKAGLVTEKTKTIVNHWSTGCQTNRQEVS